jgi:hypothetical protein
MELIVVERIFERPITDEEVIEAVRRAQPCLDIRRIKRVQTILSKDRLRSVCLYEAPDASVVRDVHDQEHIPYVKIWSGDPFDMSSVQAGPSESPATPE